MHVKQLAHWVLILSWHEEYKILWHHFIVKACCPLELAISWRNCWELKAVYSSVWGVSAETSLPLKWLFWKEWHKEQRQQSGRKVWRGTSLLDPSSSAEPETFHPALPCRLSLSVFSLPRCVVCRIASSSHLEPWMWGKCQTLHPVHLDELLLPKKV